MAKVEHISTVLRSPIIGEGKAEPAISTKDVVVNMPKYKVWLHNDEKNSMDHVVMVLKKIFHIDNDKAEKIMLEAHNNQIALCAVEPLEVAELRRDQLVAYSLVATVEKE